MFRKIVSNLAFSPALVGQLGFYAKRLRQEEATRRVGLIFTALALVVQSFAVFSPPESANASNPSNFVNGGVSSVSQYLSNYDANSNNIKDLFTTLGITRANIANAKPTSFNSKTVYSWALTPRFSASQGEHTYTVRTSNGSTRTFYYRPLSLWDSTSYTIQHGSTYYGWSGVTSSGMYFAFMKNCGNLILKVVPPAPKCPTVMTGAYPACTTPPKMCTIAGKTNLLASDSRCRLEPIATCENLKITKLLDNYQLTATASAANGAKITGYIYTIKKDGKVVKTLTVTSSDTTNFLTYQQKAEGTYTVELVAKTTLGDRSSTNCVKTFSIAAPEMCPQNPQLLLTSPDCQACPDDSTLWIKDEKCAANVIETKSATNITQGDVNAVTTTALASDKILYTLDIENTGKAPAAVTVTERLDDVSEYATLLDNGGGAYDADQKLLSWPTFTLGAGEKQTRMFTVQVLDTIPAMGQGTSDKTSYDCKMLNTFGNAVEINVQCPIQKAVVEQTVAELPHTGPRENMMFAVTVFAIVTYFYARSRQLKKEVRLIRRDLNAGTI